MTFRVKSIFWGLLIGSLLCSSLAFSQVVQVVQVPTPGQIPGGGSAGGTAPPAQATPYPPTATQNTMQPQAPSGQSSYPPSTTSPVGAYPAATTAPPGMQAPGVPGAPYAPGAALPAGAYPPPTVLPGGQVPGAPGVPTAPGGVGPLPTGLLTPDQRALSNAQIPSQALPGYGQPGAIAGEELSPFEQYVSGKIPQAISFDIKQFGYDLFLQSAHALSTANAPQGMPPQGNPTQGMPSQGTAAQSTSVQGMPVPGTSPPGVALQGVTGQGASLPRAPASGMPYSPGLGIPSSNSPVGPDYVIGPGDEIRISVWGSVEGAWSALVDRDGTISLPKVGTVGVTGMNFQELREFLLKELSKYYKDFQLSVSLGTLRTMTVYVVGNARAPGAYPVSSLSTIINALMVAGGPSKSGSMRDIQLKRNGQTIAHLDLYDFLINGDKTKDQRLLAEDVIFIPPIGPIVGVAGNIDRPAIYELKGKMILSDGLKLAGGVTAAAYMQRVQVERVFQKQTKVIVDVNLEKFKGKFDIPLQDGDIVKVFPIVPLVTNRVVLQGNVKRPGDYEWKPGMRAKDLLPSADGLLPDAFLDYALITRLVPPDNHQEYRSFDLGAVLSRSDNENNILLEPYDVVTVYNKWDVVQRDKVRITGAVNKPGEFDFRPNMKLSDLLKLAGGLRKFAFGSKAELTRVTPMPTGPMTEQIKVNPEAALGGDSDSDLTLQQDDYLFVRAVPDWQLYRKVSLMGEVKFPGDYALKKSERLSSLIDRAGGFTDKAYTRGATLTRLSVRDTQQKQLNDMVNRLQRELLAMSSADVAGAMTADDAKIQVSQSQQKQLFLASLRQIQPNGRMVVNVEDARRSKDSTLDVEMEDGDVLNVPTNPQSVQVIGAVNNQANFVFEPAKDYSFYVDRAGGFSRTADKSELYIIKVDGATIKPGWGLFWNTGARQWENGSPNLIEPGDTIVVPDDIMRIAWVRELKDWVQIFYQSMVGAGVVVKLFQ
jgi:protein involved in polysaccharide export with SLBB domain